MNALLMAHGIGARFLPGTEKQLINAGGRPLIRRTYDQLVSRGIDNVVVIAPERFVNVFPEDVRVHSFGSQYNEPLLHGVHVTSSYWHADGVVIILGDVLFSSFAMDWLMTGNDTKFLGRFTPSVVSGKEAPELFALRIAPSDYDTIIHYCQWMTDRENKVRAKPRFWSLLAMMSGGDVQKHDSTQYNPGYFMAINDYTDDIDSLIEYRKFFGPMLKAAISEDGNASNS